MSSTSSSYSDNGDYCQCGNSPNDCCNLNTCSCSYYGRHIGSSRHVPFCTTIGHPLIYYAEVQRPCRRQRCDPPKKENQNCFVKAFKWYTQERVPDKINNDAVASSGFANWLDSKYIEYLRESRPNQVYQLTVQETTTIEPCVPCSSPCEPCTTKKFARLRSPWRKRRRPCKDSGDVAEKSQNQSCEFIMQPKDLTRAASDCCYPAPASGCFKSNATVASSNAPGTTRCSGRSHSLSSVCRERSVPKHIDTIPCTVQEGSKTQQSTKPPTICRREQIQQMPSKSRKADVSCQCPEEQVIPVNAETQYEPMGYMMPCPETFAPCYCIIDDGHSPKPAKKRSRKLSTPEMKPSRAPSTQSYTPKKHKKPKKQPSVSCQCPEESIARVDTQSQYQTDSPNMCECRNVCAPCAPCRDNKEMNQVFGPKTLRRQSLSTGVVNETADACECTVKEVPVATMSKCTCSRPCFANDTVQTSDHSICLERGGVHPYPLFMKIVCADRLN